MSNVFNALEMLRTLPEFADLLGFDEMLMEATIRRSKPVPLGDADITDINAALQQAGLSTVGRIVTEQAIFRIALNHRYHPIRDWLSKHPPVRAEIASRALGDRPLPGTVLAVGNTIALNAVQVRITFNAQDTTIATNLINLPVQVTILRDKKQQSLTLQVDSKRKSDVEFNGLLPDGPCPLMALADPAFAQDLARGLALSESDIQSMREQSEALKDQFRNFGDEGGMWKFEISPEQTEQFRKQAEQFGDAFKDQDFHLDQKQLDQMKQQMEEFQKNFKPEDFKLDQKQLDQLKNQMQQFRQSYPPDFDKKLQEEMKRQMDQLKRQMEEMRALGFGDHV